MMEKTYYLNLLYAKVKELKELLDNIDSEDYSDEHKKYLISGYIITLDSILEVGISDLHSTKLDELTSLIYYTRQKAVHYGYFNGLHNIENIANEIIQLTELYHKEEQEYYSSLINSNNFELTCNNVLIKDSPNISSIPSFYKFKSSDGSKDLLIPSKKVFSLTKKNKDKISNYIIDLDAIGSLCTYEDGSIVSYEEITQDQLKEFISSNFHVVEENFNKHNKTISKIITNFIKDPINSVLIMEYASNEQFCRNTIDVIKEFILERKMFDAYIECFQLIKTKYSFDRMQKTDYVKLQRNSQRMQNCYI